MADAVSGFIDEDARTRFMRAFEKAMATWPRRVDHRVETSFGSTMVSEARGEGHAAPVVLLQGGASTVAVWAPFAAAWMRERPVVAIDTVWDAGRSIQSRPVIDGSDAAMWVDETLAGLGIDRAHLVGYSYGGWIALNQAAHRPARLLSVTAIEPPGTITGMPIAAWWRMLRTLFGDERRYRDYLAWVRGGRLPESELLDVLLSAYADFVQRGNPRPRRLTRDQWARLETPASVLLAGESRFISSRAATSVLRRDAPQVDVEVLTSASHAVLVDEPGRVIEHVAAFTRQHDRGTDE